MSQKPLEIHGRLLARNTILNCIGQIIPILIGVVTIPIIIKGLGTERFGVLSLAWVVLSYFSFFDLGLGRATTKFVAEILGKGEIPRLPTVVWSSLAFNFLLGIIGGAVLFAITPFLVEQVFNIPPLLREETRTTFFLLAACVPVLMVTVALRGVLEASQRFDLVNALQIPNNSLLFLIPAVVLPFSSNLAVIMLLLLLARVGALIAFLTLCLKTFPILKERISIDARVMRPLLAFGLWITVSSILSPLLLYLDRLLIGSLLTMTALAYYTAPYEMVIRTRVFPAGLVSTLFPAFSTLTENKKAEISQLFARSVKYVFLLMGPLLLVIIFFAENILSFWLGMEYAQQSKLVLQILSLGVLFNSLAYVPFCFVQGLGRPDITAKFHILELPIFLGLAWVFISQWGIAGAALAWTIRVALDALLLFGAAWRILPSTVSALVQNGFVQSVCALIGVTMMNFFLPKGDVINQCMIIIGSMILFILFAWRYSLDNIERSLVLSIVVQLVSRKA